MNDVTKKRLIGVVVLVIIGVLAPLLLSRCMHGSSENGKSAMRVYNINPNGQAKRASADSNPQVDGSTGPDTQEGSQDGSQAAAGPSHPDAVSPQSASTGSSSQHGFKTPPIQGGADSDETDSADEAEIHSSEPPQSSTQSTPLTTAQTPSRPTIRSSSAPAQGGASSSSAVQRDLAGWAVQVASFTEASKARDLASQLGGQFKASYSPGTVNGTTWYRVNVGPFDTEAEAQSAAARLRQQGRKPLVRHLP